MRRLIFGFSILLFLFLSVRPTSAQQNLVNVTLTLPQYNQIYVADLDVENAKSSGILFTVTVQNLTDEALNLRLHLAINLNLAGQQPFPNFVTGQSNPFTLNPHQTMIVTNVDLASDNSPITLDRSNYHYDQAEFDQIKNVALATGKAPAGVYQFELDCVDARTLQPVSSSPANGQIVVTNPSRVDLVLPMNGENVTTLFPHFQWSANADSVTLSVYQKLPSQQSAQDVVSGVPFLQQVVVGSSFNYPPSGAGVRPLENGKTYYWFVDVTPSATRGSGIRSDIWSFTVGGIDTSGRSSADDEAATKALINLLSGTQYQGLLNQISTLTGTASYDGASLTIQDLMDILQNMDKSKITNVTVQ
jgi:hypothetical protein